MHIHRPHSLRAMKTLVVLTIVAMLTPISSGIALADGTETLGAPSVAIAEGSGFVAGGVGLENGQPGTINVTVPVGAGVSQALLYWEGQSRTSAGGDDTVSVDGVSVTGSLIGGPTRFFGNAWSSTYRADITDFGLVEPGTNALSVGDMDFTRVNNGAGVLVIYDDGSQQDLRLVDGNDLAFINFAPPLDTTVPQTFTFDPVPYDRVVEATMFAASVTPDGIRPNAVVATVDGVVTTFANPFDSNDGREWDTAVIQVDVPAGATSLTLQALSADTEGTGALPASFAWLASGVSVPLPAALGDFVWLDNNRNGIQDPGEPGVEDVLVTLNDCNGNLVNSQLTGPDGEYLFTLLEPGCYQVTFTAPDGTSFTIQNAGPDDIDSNADPATGVTPQVTLVSGEQDLTIDAGLVLLLPGIDIEKLTNGNDADGANDADVPQIAPGDAVTWTYVVTNTGDVAYAESEVEVTDDIVGDVTDIVDQGDGDGVLAPGEIWVYEATAPGGAQDLTDPEPGTVIVDGCNPAGTPVPGERATYENVGLVTVPGDEDSDPSHYCNPPMPGIDIEKLTNGNDADGANDADVPQIAPGDAVTWTYVVTNTGDVAYAESEVEVTDDIVGDVTDIVDQGDGDGVLAPGEIWVYEATAPGGAQDLTDPEPGTVIVDGCNPAGTPVPGERATYENVGLVTVPGDEDSDPSHYCNPPMPGIDIEKLTNGNDADGANDADVPQIAPGDAVTWTYVVTNTGDVAYAESEVEVTDDIVGDVTDIVDQGDGDGVLAPGEIWVYEATAPGGAQDLTDPEPGTVIVDGCNPAGTPVPGERATYENVGLVTVPGDEDSDPSHYCNPPMPGIDIEKLTNGNDADGANDADVPQIAPGDAVTWTYVVTNTGDVAYAESEVEVTDDIVGDVTDIVDQGDGDGVLAPGEIWVYEATAPGGAQDLTDPEPGTVIVDGCNPAGTPVPGERATYENVGLVTVPGDEDSDPSHYCNPPMPEIDIEKFTKVIVTQTGGDLCEVFGKPAQLTMVYTGDGPEATSNSQDPGKVVVTGDPDDASPVLIVASKDEGGGGDVYFDGTVNLNGDFVIDSTLAGQDDLASTTHVTIYDVDGSILQAIEFHTSCSQPLLLGDQYGAARLVGFIDKDGDGATLPPPSDDFGEDADEPTGPTAGTGDTIQWTYFVTNPGDLALADVAVTDDNGTADDQSDDFVAAPILDGGVNVGDTNSNGLLDPGEEWLFQAMGIAQLGQYANIGSVEGQPVLDGNPFGDPVTDTDPSHYIGIFSGDLCEVFGKPAQLTMVYTGDGPEATSNSQDPGKVVVTGDPDDASPVQIVASKDEGGGGDVYFDGTVNLNGDFVIDSTLAGQDDLASTTHVTIYDVDGSILQAIEFHTSCSQPLFIGDQFGAIQLVDFVDKDGDGPGTVPDTGVTLSAHTFKGKEVKIEVTNNGTADVFITEVSVSWPTAVNDGLTEIKRAGDSIYKPEAPVTTSPLVLEEGDWTAAANKRTVKDGETKEFKFKFENDVLQDVAAYTIVMTFSDGSEVTFGG